MAQDFKELFEFNKEKFFSCPLFFKGEKDKDLIEDIKNSKIVIYTAFTGGYDNLKDPEFIDENCDYICFTDNPDTKSDVWKIIPIESSNLDNNRIAKQFKVLPHKFFPEYKYSLWIDGTFKIVGSIREYIYEYLRNPMLNVMHDDRDCVYDEFIISSSMSRYPTGVLEKQVKKYKNEGFPAHYGLPSAGVIFRQHHNPIIIKVMEDWWKEIIEFTNQDQISFSYVCWKNNFNPSASLVFYWSNEYWTKKVGFRHEYKIENALTSCNLINNIKSGKKDPNDLNSNEVQLLYNDLLTLEYENTHSQEYHESRLFVYQDGKKYILKNFYHLEDENCIKYDLNYFDNIERISFSPISRKYVFCSIESIDSDAKDFKIVKSNSKNSHSAKKQLFGKLPFYDVDGDFKNASYFEAKFSIAPMNKREFKLEDKILKLNKENKKLNKKLDEFKSRKIVKMTDKTRKLLKH